MSKKMKGRLVSHDSYIKRHGSMEIEENMGAQKRLWAIQRIVRPSVVVILFLALLGLFGGGYLSRGEFTQDETHVEYERIGYRETPQEYEIKVSDKYAAAGKIRIWFHQDSLKQLGIEKITPEPARWVLAKDKTIFEFDSDPTAGSGNLQILFKYKPIATGNFIAQLGVENGPHLELKQFFLP